MNCTNENFPDSKSWEEWRKRDEKFVEKHFDEELSKAILLSKQDYEEKKEVYEFIKKECEKTKRVQKRDSLKNELEKRILKISANDSQSSTSNSNGMFNSDKEVDFSVPASSLNSNESNRLNVPSEENFALVTLQAILENKDEEIHGLKLENEKLNDLLTDVKMRNSKLCQIIAHGESKFYFIFHFYFSP